MSRLKDGDTGMDDIVYNLTDDIELNNNKQKKDVLICVDVKGWGGYERALKIKDVLNENGYEVDISTADSLIGVIQRFNYELYYFLFHTMIVSQECKILLCDDKKVLAAVTGYPVSRQCFLHEDDISKKQKIDKRDPKVGFIKIAKYCCAMTANNIKSFEQLKGLYKGDGNVYYTPRGVDTDLFYEELPFNSDQIFTMGYVGKPVPGKGLDSIIKPACKEAGVRLITNTRNYTNALSLDQMREFYSYINVYIVASSVDGTPNPALEAAACQRPIISNPIGNMSEFIKDGVNGLLVPKLEVEYYVDAIMKLKNDYDKTKKMGIEARKTVLENWTWKHSMVNELKMVVDIIGEPIKVKEQKERDRKREEKAKKDKGLSGIRKNK